MMVNPAEIVIDMPVDEVNINQKMDSMRERGIIQPVTLWLQGMRVIDGFHRTVAAQRLGWQEIPCYVVDCSEDAFWDARIQSARQHHKIENERLNAWILESWKTTEWYTPMNIAPELLEIYGSNGNDERALTLSILDTLWTLYKRDGAPRKWVEEEERMVGKRNPKPKMFKVTKMDDNSPHKVNPQIVEWVESKARRWGIFGATCRIRESAQALVRIMADGDRDRAMVERSPRSMVSAFGAFSTLRPPSARIERSWACAAAVRASAGKSPKFWRKAACVSPLWAICSILRAASRVVPENSCWSLFACPRKRPCVPSGVS